MQEPPADYLPSVIPELKTCRLVITYEPGEPHPEEGNFIVSVGKNRRVGTVYQVISARKMKSKHPGKWELQCVRCPELKEKTVVNFRFYTWVDNVPALTIVWNPRNKKKK